MNKFINLVSKTKEKFLDELYPKQISCYSCSDEIRNKNCYNLCQNCIDKIVPLKNICKKCGDELNSFTSYCENCKNIKRNFDLVRSVTGYEGVAKLLVYKLKYGKEKYIAETIAQFLINYFKTSEFEDIDLVTCVPTTDERVKIRGYNQAEVIAQIFVKKLNLNYNFKCINRVKNTTTQTVLSKIKRRENLVDAFNFDKSLDINNKNILIIDDVITTGSTLDEIAKLLKKNGANKVYGLTFCHTKIENLEN